MAEVRFNDQFRTDADAPVRRAQIVTRTPVLSHDGADLAVVLQTIGENGHERGLENGHRQRLSRQHAAD